MAVAVSAAPRQTTDGRHPCLLSTLLSSTGLLLRLIIAIMELLSQSVNALKMQSIILEHIKGEDLTKRLTEVLEFDPAGTYRVTVQIEDEELASAASLPELAEILSKRAQSRGLTPELLTDILDGVA
jgi:hypothetical protein